MNYYSVIQSGDIIEHHEILGMKWGVRRYQNADGSLTPAGEKRYNKNLAYRNKTVAKNKRKIETATQRKKEADSAIKDLKKNGTESETYKKWEREEKKRREREYNTKRAGTDAPKYNETYMPFINSIDLAMKHYSGIKVNDIIKDYKSTSDYHSNTIKRLTERNEDIMNMEISALTSRRQIRRGY